MGVVIPGEGIDIAALFRQYSGAVARWAARMGGPGFDVEDAVQEVFLIAQRRLVDQSVEPRVRAWLFRTTERVVRHHRRKNRWRHFLGRGEELESLPGRSSPVDDLEHRENVATVYRILDGLSERDRTLLVLFEVEAMSGEDIAALTDTRIETVWVQLHRARVKFVQRMTVERAKELKLP